MDSTIPEGFKRCNKCDLVKPLDEFYTMKRPNGIRSPKYICKECENVGSQSRFKQKKVQANKKCAYPPCDTIIVPSATYCSAHFRLNPEEVERRASKFPPKSTCIFPGCGKLISRGASYCHYHYNRRERSHVTKSKMSMSAKRRANTPEGRARMSQAASLGGKTWKGRHHTQETRDKIRGKRAMQILSRESLEKTWSKTRGRPGNRGGIPHTEEVKARISTTLQSKREHLSRKGRERYERETEEQREKRLNHWIQAGQESIAKIFSGTTIEMFIAQQLDTLGIEYEMQKKIGYYIADFCIPSHMIVIEAMGCFWHGCEQCGYNEPWHILKREKEKVRTERIVKKGYSVVALWEHEIRRAMQDSGYILQLGIE